MKVMAESKSARALLVTCTSPSNHQTLVPYCFQFLIPSTLIYFPKFNLALLLIKNRSFLLKKLKREKHKSAIDNKVGSGRIEQNLIFFGANRKCNQIIYRC